MAAIYCKTDVAILLLAVPDQRGVLHFPVSEGHAFPGLHMDVKPLTPIFGQLSDLATSVVGRSVATDIHIWDEFADEIEFADGIKATLYVANLKGTQVPDNASWPVMPTILRSLPKTRIRLPYLRAWQILQGGLTLNTKAVDPADVAKYLDD